jgi:putative thioredoxin
MYIDVTDATFQAEVVDRSMTTPVVVDLWAEWCGPCKQLGPIIEAAVAATNGKVVLAKIDVDSNPASSKAFEVQSIPAVYALKDGKVVDGFIGAKGQADIDAFIAGLLPTEEESQIDTLLAAGDEASLRQALELEPDNADAINGLASLLVEAGQKQEALDLLAKIPETPEGRHIAALARAANAGVPDDVEAELLALLGTVKTDEDAKQRYVDLLELMGSADPRTAEFRKKLSTALF